jgi:MFS family permease
MLSITQPHHYYQVFLAQSIGEGLGMGIMFVPSLAVSSHYFRKRRSLAMGLIIVGPHTPLLSVQQH